MKCKFCAEEIQDEAIVCRFCGAVKEDGAWRRTASPPVARTAPRGQFTLRTAAVLFWLSALTELASIDATVALLGSLREGPVAWLVHLLYASLFVALGVGLWAGRPWGPPLVIGATLLYTVDRLLYVFDRPLMEAQLQRSLDQVAGSREILEFIDKESILSLTSMTVILVVACWWGFALYVWLRRGYFRQSTPTGARDSEEHGP